MYVVGEVRVVVWVLVWVIVVVDEVVGGEGGVCE